MIDDYLKEFCLKHGYYDPWLTTSQASAILKYMMFLEIGFLLDDLNYISVHREWHSPGFRRFLEDVIGGKIKRPAHRTVDRHKKVKIVGDFMKLAKEGYPLKGKTTIDGIEYIGGLTEYLARKHKISDRTVEYIHRDVRAQTLEGFKESLRESQPELDPSSVDALAEEYYLEEFPGLPLPAKKE